MSQAVPDPWDEDDDEPPPKWLGQQAGCLVAAAVGVAGLALFGLALIVLWVLLTRA